MILNGFHLQQLDNLFYYIELLLVKIKYATICGSDLHTYQGSRNTPVPTILGHEIIGEIEILPREGCLKDYYGNDLKVGDMLIYSGCELEHWREPFEGTICSQVFLHYNDRTKKTAKENLYDKRAFLGLPAWFKGFKLLPTKK